MSLIEIQQKLKAPKGQTNNFGNYKYRSCEDILEAVKPHLGDMVLTLSDEMVEVGGRVYVKATATLTGDNDPVTVTAYAREAETKKGMDDSQITGTASSYARKYALNGLFLIDDTQDADTDAHKEQLDNPLIAYNAAVRDNFQSIAAIKLYIQTGELGLALEAWNELDETREDGTLDQTIKKAIWKAPSAGGCFNTSEREVIKSPEFKNANGENSNGE